MRCVVGLVLLSSCTMVLSPSEQKGHTSILKIIIAPQNNLRSQRSRTILLLVCVWGDSAPSLVFCWGMQWRLHLEVVRRSLRSSLECCWQSWPYSRVPCLGMMPAWAGWSDSWHKVISGKAGQEAKPCCLLTVWLCICTAHQCDSAAVPLQGDFTPCTHLHSFTLPWAELLFYVAVTTEP